MAFCDKEKQLIDSGYTCIDNKFILNYLADAPDVRSAVYLMGLTLCESSGDDNSRATIAQKLGISEEDVMSAYYYWQELGLVHITGETPPRVIYLNVDKSTSALKKIKPGKYTKFSQEMQRIIEGRMLTVNEYNEYYMFLEDTTFEPEALLAVAKYCVELKGNNINYHYILTVARNQLTRGATTLLAVQDNLNSQQKYDDDLKLVFKALGTNRKIDHDDRELYEKWTKEFGFTLETVIAVAKKCKKGGMTALDGRLCEYYKKGALSVVEIDNYDKEKTQLYNLARDINKCIGVYYQSLDAIVDEYVTNWVRKGFDEQTLIAIAKYCFRSGIRTLAGLASIIEKLYKNGVTTLTSLEQYLAQVSAKDENILAILKTAGLDRRVTNNDRALYRTWTEIWGMPQDVILVVAEKSAGTTTPTAYINRVLADYKQKGITTVEQAQSYQPQQTIQPTQKTAIIGQCEIYHHEYTDQQLNSLFSALDEEDD
ncbi:MAG: DnaD domain protein [Clostridia bacterium]|nr:DnaD domain protein [Clostridia bacterium]